MNNKHKDFIIKLLMLSIEGVSKKCTDYVIVIDRNNNTEKVITYKGKDPFVLASLLYKNISISESSVSEIYYHKMTGMDIVVIGVLTADCDANQEILLRAV